MQNHCTLHDHPRRTMHFAHLRRDVGRRLGFGGIKNPIGEQFHAVIHEEPYQSSKPTPWLPSPSRWVP